MRRRKGPQMNGHHHPGGALFSAWFVFCLLLALAMLAGVVWLVVELLPHVTGALDRAGQ